MSARYRLVQFIFVALTASCGGGGGGGASAPTTNDQSQQEQPVALSEIKAASSFEFAHFRSISVTVETDSFVFVGNHVFLKLYPAGTPGQSLFLGEIRSSGSWQTNVALENTADQLAWELYSDANESYEGSVDVADMSAVSIQGAAL